MALSLNVPVVMGIYLTQRLPKVKLRFNGEYTDSLTLHVGIRSQSSVVELVNEIYSTLNTVGAVISKKEDDLRQSGLDISAAILRDLTNYVEACMECIDGINPSSEPFDSLLGRFHITLKNINEEEDE